MQKQSLHSFGRTLMILSFLYISYSFVVSRPVSGTLRDFQTPFSSKGKFVGTAQTNSQGRKCSIYKLQLNVFGEG